MRHGPAAASLVSALFLFAAIAAVWQPPVGGSGSKDDGPSSVALADSVDSHVLMSGFGAAGEWSSNVTGTDILVAFSIAGSPSSECTIDFLASGRGEPSALTVLIYDLVTGDQATSWAGSLVEVYSPFFTYAPAGPGYHYTWTGLPVDGNGAFLFAGFNLYPIDGETTFRIAFECTESVTYLAIEAASVARVINGEANGLVGAEAPIASAAVDIDNGMAAQTWGLVFFSKHGHGPCVLEIAMPSGVESHAFAVASHFARAGGPGTYSMRISDAGAGLGHQAFGLLIGFDVGSPDQFWLEVG